jgi:hypothetical protein
MDETIDRIIDALIELLESGDEIPDELLDEVTSFIQDEIGTARSLASAVTPPIPDNAQLLWTLAGGDENAFVSYLREFPDPTLEALLTNPGNLANTIQQLQRNNPIERDGQWDGIKQAPLQSSNIYGFKFDPKNKRMLVKFQSGSLYQDEGIPDVIFNLFSRGNATAKTNGRNKYGAWFRGKNPSLGASLNQYIKAGGFPYKRLK